MVLGICILGNISSDPKASPLLDLGLPKGIDSGNFKWTLENTENLGNIKYLWDQNLNKGRDLSINENFILNFIYFQSVANGFIFYYLVRYKIGWLDPRSFQCFFFVLF